MKKILLVMSILAMAFVSCSKDDANTQNDGYKLVVNISEKPAFNEVSRAVRTSWENGDVVYVVFDGDLYDGATAAKYLTLTYNNSSWTPTWVGTTIDEVAAKTTKTLRALYVNTPVTPEFWGNGRFLTCDSTTKGVYVMQCIDGTYTASDSTITLNIALDHECSQITVRGIDVAGNWTLSCNELHAIMGGTFMNNDDVGVSATSFNDPLAGFANADGVSFYGYYPGASTSSNLIFTLSNGTKTYTRSFTDNGRLKAGDAIIMDGPDSGKWTEVVEE
ncbi:MAG: hypothetical protein IIW60_00950 [Alistipes sp.]|nr:hypothetical protein [Alistipes sp.]